MFSNGLPGPAYGNSRSPNAGGRDISFLVSEKCLEDGLPRSSPFQGVLSQDHPMFHGRYNIYIYIIYIVYSRWWQLKDFLEFSSRKLGMMGPILTSMLFNWVGSTTT